MRISIHRVGFDHCFCYGAGLFRQGRMIVLLDGPQQKKLKRKTPGHETMDEKTENGRNEHRERQWSSKCGDIWRGHGSQGKPKARGGESRDKTRGRPRENQSQTGSILGPLAYGKSLRGSTGFKALLDKRGNREGEKSFLYTGKAATGKGTEENLHGKRVNETGRSVLMNDEDLQEGAVAEVRRGRGQTDEDNS